MYRSLADAMVEEGMLAKGYRYLHVDDCWVGGRNATTGELYPDPTRFPHGMASLASYVHSRGLLFGICERTCQTLVAVPLSHCGAALCQTRT